MRPIVVIGHAALDHVYRIESLPPAPGKVRALEHVDAGGGMAANAAAAIGRLGGLVELWSRIGEDAAGQSIRASLEADRVDTTHVRAFPGRRSSTAAVIVDARGERLIVGERDHAMSMDAGWLPIARIDAASVVLSDGRWLEATRLAFARARAAGVATVLDADPGGGGDLRVQIALADYAILSAAALDELAGPGDDLARLAIVRALGPRHAGVTRGGEGYTWLGANGSGRQRAFPVQVVDTTGAGDAFHGAYALALAEGRDEAECARFAAAVAALKCRRLGARAGLPTAAEVAALLYATQ
ncbi:MAG: PfkB family carbohydrate kinase [Pseudomonadota bacterium]